MFRTHVSGLQVGGLSAPCPFSKSSSSAVPTPVPAPIVFLSPAGPDLGQGKNLAGQLLEGVTVEHCTMSPRFETVITASSSAWVPL